jgi:hypothetical protein
VPAGARSFAVRSEIIDPKTAAHYYRYQRG